MTLEELANEYLVTADGRTPQDPCGAWCGDGDVRSWAAVLIRLRRAVWLTVKRNNDQVVWPSDVAKGAALWMMRANRVKAGGSVLDVFGGGTEPVYALINLGREGVQVLFDLQQAATAQGGEVPGPGPYPDDREGGNEPVWFIAGAVAIVALLVWSRKS